jgi:alpha-1,3-rhamnosyl/mannosyltransferase
VEAAACGTPVVATTASPLPALLEGGGIFVAPGEDAALTVALRLLLTDEATRRRMGRTALERARQLSWETGAARALSALREVMA